jgi:hypothetical protein
VKKYAAAAVIAALALSGCAVSLPAPGAAPAPTVTWTPAAPADEARTMVEYASEAWAGPNRPDAAWIESTVLLICKRTIGGYELNVLPDYFYAEKNTRMLYNTAMKYECGDVA